MVSNPAQGQLRLGQLGPNDDLFIEIYQELLKHELCLMRLGDLCVKRNGFYVSRSMQSVVHNVDAQLTMLDIVYAVLNPRLLGNYKFNGSDFGSFIDRLVESRLLIDLPCDAYYRRMVEDAINRNNVLDIGLGENPFIYYYMAQKLSKRDDYGEIERYIRGNLDRCFRTAYGELIRLFRYETALPRSTSPYSDIPYRVLESYVLPFIEEHIPVKEPKLFDDLFKGLGKLIPEAQYVRDALLNANIESLDEYQAEVIKKMASRLDTHKLVVVSAPTGSGKTIIFLVHVLLKLLRYGGVAVIIYPTRALAREQLSTVINILYFLNKKPPRGRKVHVYILDKDSPKKPYRNKPFRGGLRVGRGVLRYDEDGNVVLIEEQGNNVLDRLDWVHEDRSADIVEPAIVITNHAMLSLHLTKESKWARQLVSGLNTIVVDEAHVFINDLTRSLVLHFLLTRLLVNAAVMSLLRNNAAINDIKGGIRSLIKQRRIDIILSSATLGDRRVIDEKMTINQLGGVDLVDLSNKGLPDLRPLLKWIMDLYPGVIYVPYYDKVSKGKSLRRLIVTAINFPSSVESAQNPFIEGLASAIIWTEGVSRGLGRAYGIERELHALAFLDSKESQREVFRRLIRRGLREEAFHADKLLISPLMNLSTRGGSIIRELLTTGDQDPLTDQYLRTYSHLQLMLRHSDIVNYVRAFRNNNAQQAQQIVAHPLGFAASLYNAQLNNGVFYVDRTNNTHYVLIHNADLDAQLRSGVENVLTNGRWRLAIATSTLELGVNIPNVAVVLQFGAPPSSESFIQRVGRAGRDIGAHKSLRISFGALFLKNAGKDISYIDETQAFKSLFNLEQPKYPVDVDDETLIRYMTLLYRDLGSINVSTRNHVMELVITQLYGRKANLVDEITKLMDNYKRIEDEIKNAVGSGNAIGIHSMNVIIDNVRKDLNDARANLQDAITALSNVKVSGITFTDHINTINSIVERLKDIVVNSIDQSSRLRFITIESLRIMDELNSARDAINKISDSIKGIGTEVIYKQNIRLALEYLDKAMKSLINAQSDLSQLITANISTTGGHVSSLVDLIMGLRVPNPAIIEGITGITLTCNDVGDGNNAVLQCNDRNSSREDVLRNVPFKHYGD